MADHIPLDDGTGPKNAATDELVTLNGAAAPANVHAQRIKVGYGADGEYNEVSAAQPWPVTLPTAQNAALSNLDADLGALDASPAPPDGSGNYSVIGGLKRLVIAMASALSNWTTLLSRVPSLLTTVPPSDVSAPPARLVGQGIWTCSFAGSGASVLSSDFAQPPIVGTGVGYSQANGSLLITTGTATNAEFLARSVATWRGAMRLRASIVASQRIANQNLGVLLADLVGEGLAFTINSATSVTVNLPGHTFTAQNVGQFINLAGIAGAAGVPGRYAIASVVAGVSINFTVAGWPASGSGALTLMGWNYVRNLFNGTTATAVAWDAQRNGWASGDTTAAINTTASPGTIIQNDMNGRDAFLMDALRATSTTPNFVTRASRYENLPDDNVQLYLWVWSFNGTTAPASTTTWTLGFLSLESFAALPVYLQGARASGAANAFPVAVQGTATVAGTVTANQGTMAALPAGTNAIGAVRLVLPELTADVASAAITTSAATAAFTPTAGHSYEVNVPVTAVNGTTPTLDLSIEESDDSGTNWFKVYDFPRITATGMYRSPKLPLTGNRVRYVQTVAGTTPSFTRAVNRLMSSDPAPALRQLVDRTVALTALNSTTPSLDVRHCRNLQLAINLGAATTPPQIQLEGSEDNGASWYSIGSPLAGVASSTVQVIVNSIQTALVRGRVSVVGASVTPGYVLIKGF